MNGWLLIPSGSRRGELWPFGLRARGECLSRRRLGNVAHFVSIWSQSVRHFLGSLRLWADHGFCQSVRASARRMTVSLFAAVQLPLGRRETGPMRQLVLKSTPKERPVQPWPAKADKPTNTSGYPRLRIHHKYGTQTQPGSEPVPAP
jgi:hypothetical protein